MATFTAENVDSAGELFATEKVNASSVHYPLSKLVWGTDSTTFNAVDASTPLPVQVFQGGASTAPVFVDQIGYVAPSTTVTVTNIAANDTVFTQTGYVAPSTTFTQTGYVAPSTTVTLTNPTDSTVTISAAVPQSSVTIASGTITTVSSVAGVVSVEPTSSANVGLDARSAAGGLSATVLQLSSLMQSPMTAVGRLYGYSLSNPDTADNAFALFYQDDSAGVTLGTSSASMSVMVPFGGGANVTFPQGVDFSSGLTITSAATGNSTSHDTPAASLTATLYYDPST